MSNSSPSWHSRFHNWIISHNILDVQSLKCLNEYLFLLIELQELQEYQRKKYDYNLTQQKVDKMTNSDQLKEVNIINHQQSNDKVIKFKDIQFIELLKFILIETKDQIEFGEKLKIERYIKGKTNDEYSDALYGGEGGLYDASIGTSKNPIDDAFIGTSNNPKRYSRDSISSISTLSIDFFSSLQFYPKRIFDYLDYEDNLYKLIIKKQLEIIYEVGDITKNIESLERLLLIHGPFPKQDASLFLIIIYSTFQLLEKLEDTAINIDKELIKLKVDLIYNLKFSFMKRIENFTLDLVDRNYFEDLLFDKSDKMIKFYSFLRPIIIIFQLYFFSSLLYSVAAPHRFEFPSSRLPPT
ncbi:unnamed protein product [Rhizophagus irregularis]|uniref:Uncharacterized protein n=1 Tax=Rhizophagus irregularis TaxID=588596 RepID=A0A2N1MQH1_9GLOM|nr:hypothetical protein RhiirC2_124458 [Rhizophagus irregularis]CAB4401924.1 unnamed protein product [Rhizophagus irregularis]